MQHSLVGRVRDALAEDRFVLHAQPIVDLATERRCSRSCSSACAARTASWSMPGEFLPAGRGVRAASSEIDRWVVARGRRLAAPGQAVEVNLSAPRRCAPGLV